MCSAVSESRASSCGFSWDKNMGDLENVKRRVRKLLALSKSPNEDEEEDWLKKMIVKAEIVGIEEDKK